MKRYSAAKFKFTDREKKIAALIARGSSRKVIADKLKVSVNTIREPIAVIRAKIGAESMYAAGCILSHYF